MNKHYRRQTTVKIKCSNQVLPTAMQQLKGVVNVEMSSPQVALGNVQQVKPVELVPNLNVQNVPLLPNGRRIPRG